MGQGEPYGEFMVMHFTYSTGATPIDPDEAAGLVPTHITTQAELNAWEEANMGGGQFCERRNVGVQAQINAFERRLFAGAAFEDV